MKKFLALLPLGALVFAAACSDAPTAAKEEGAVPTGPSIIIATPEQVADYTIMLDDATERLVPALNDAATAGKLAPELKALGSAMKLRDTPGARAAFGAAQQTLAAYRANPANADFEADADAIQVVLEQADAMIGPAVSQ